jgi:hypothetical protein
VPPDCMMTVSTVATASKGAFPDSPIPAAAPWPATRTWPTSRR